MAQATKVVTISVKDLKTAFRAGFPDQKVTDMSGPWLQFWSAVLKRGTLADVPVPEKLADPVVAPASEFATPLKAQHDDVAAPVKKT